MTDLDLLGFTRSAVENIGRTLGPEDDWQPMLLVRDRDGGIGPVAIPPAGGTDLEREALWQAVVPSILVDRKAVEVVVVMTAWMSAGDPTKDVDDQLRPSLNPDRREVLCLTRVSLDDESQTFANIVRSSGPPRLEWEPDSDWKMGGRVVAGIRRGLLEG